MYNDFFGFIEKPFSIAPNPRYLYMSRHHEDALAHLIYGIKEGNGFVLLTGEVGTGKTTLCNCLLAQLPPRTDVAYILNPRVTVNELLATVCDEFSIPYQTPVAGPLSNKIFIDHINKFLLTAHAQGRQTVLIIDEAQNLSHEVLEQIRLLTNLETYEKKLLQIILIGQPELREKFSQPELRQLAQRITARFHLHELSLQEVRAYINHRIVIAGSSARGTTPGIGNLATALFGDLFSPQAEKKIHRLSGGIPRVINLICDRSLLAAYTQNKKKITAKLVNSASREVLPSKTLQANRFLSPAITGVLLMGLAISTLGFFIAKPYLLPSDHQISKVEGTAQNPSEASESLPKNITKTLTGIKSSHNPTDQFVISSSTENTITARSANKLNPQPALKHLPFPAGYTSQQTRLIAYQTLFNLWSLPLNQLTPGNECAVAQQHQLQCLPIKSNLGSLKRLSRPAVLRLVHSDGEEYYGTLIATDQQSVEIDIANQRYRVHFSAIEEAWFGDSTLIWSPPKNYQHPIDPFFTSPGTRWLRKQLSQLELTPEQQLGYTYIAPLQEQVKLFQISQGLDPDGIAGAQTLIMLNTKLNKSTPTLPTLLPSSSNNTKES
ncbi:MAG: hypothetical protein COB51_11995 [Moraxellaceae bacterium]|nr:MAG: hypothetical protein COB51_11995 [Moraxellaceae bacterium]